MTINFQMKGADAKLDLAGAATATVTRGGLKAEFNAGGVSVTVNGKTVTVDMTGKVALEAAANDAATVKSEPKIGDVMADGTVYAGISPDTNKAMFAAACRRARSV